MNLTNEQQKAVEKLRSEIETWREKFNAMATQEQTVRVECNRLRGELKQAHRERDEWREQAKMFEREFNEARTLLLAAEASARKWEGAWIISNRERDDLRAELLASEAGNAEMREVLRDAQMHIEADNIDWLRFNEGPDHDPNYAPTFPEIVSRCVKTLSITCGTAFLAERERHVKALEFYGNECNYQCRGDEDGIQPSTVNTDRGEIARTALNPA